jgi:AdoMet-dependent heme synthase
LSLKLRSISEGDIQALTNLHFFCFSKEPYPKIDFDQAFEDIKSKISKCLIKDSLVAEENGSIVAYALASLNSEGKTVVIGPVGVDGMYRGKKLGLLMIARMMKSLEDKGFNSFALRIDKKASWLEKYYSRLNFESVKEASGYIYMGFRSKKLMRFKKILFRKEDFGGLVFLRGKYYYVDKDSFHDLVLRSLHVDYSWAVPVKGDVDELLKGSNPPRASHELRAPYKMRLEITGKCNNRCVWCYASNRYDLNQLSLCDFKKIIGKFSLEGVFEVTFSGGEPMMNPDIFELVKYAHSRNIIVRMITNGTMLSKENVSKLKESGLSSLQISLEGVGKKHDDIVRNECFNDVSEGIKNAVESGIAVATNTTVSSMNKDDVEEIASFVKSLGVKRMSFNYCNTRNSSLKIDKEELIAVISKVSELKKSGMRVNWLGPLEDCHINLADFFEKPPKCSACNTSIVVGPDGSIRPCSFTDKSVGNIMSSNLSDVWNSEDFRKFRNGKIIKEKCVSCSRKGECGGGCKMELFNNFTSK